LVKLLALIKFLARETLLTKPNLGEGTLTDLQIYEGSLTDFLWCPFDVRKIE